MKLQLLHLYTAPAEAQQEKEQFSAAPVITNTHFIMINRRKWEEISSSDPLCFDTDPGSAQKIGSGPRSWRSSYDLLIN